MSLFVLYEKSFYEFTTYFDLAVTFPSSVVSDLLHSECPFLIFIPDHRRFDQSESAALPRNMTPIVDVEKLKKAILDIDATREQHQTILNSFKRDSGIITDINAIDENFEKLGHKFP